MDGILLVNKPSGMTSHDVVAVVRRKFHMRRVGHAGTLDPLATGLLVILLGQGTKFFDRFVAFDKAYRATMILGLTTTSADVEGQELKRLPCAHITQAQVEAVLKQFVGTLEQKPPMVSAVKIGGKKLYQLARQGKTIDRPSRKIIISRLELERMSPPEVQFFMECSKGTYVRQLAADVGEALGCGACISQIERTKVGPFSIQDSFRLEDIHESNVRNWQG
ncbi:MAG: tRNA pseudouridine(55) synthase TruB [Candidatus Omnitrophica bacterium]|nr:tRNA pseudouridine(55) synthase TruB [Candidatus Omnitrophota bacterium]